MALPRRKTEEDHLLLVLRGAGAQTHAAIDRSKKSAARARAYARAARGPGPRASMSHHRETSFVRSAAAGAAAAGAATLVFHPIDTVKTVLQHSASARLFPSSTTAISLSRIGGLYRGVFPATLSMAPACAARMGVYEVLKAPLLEYERAGVPPTVLIALASAVSVVASAMVRAPLDMVKTRMQSGAVSAASGTLGALRAAWTSGGLSGVYRGASLALARDVPFFSVNLALYENLKALTLAGALQAQSAAARSGQLAESEVELSAGETLQIGAVAQGVAAWLTNPLDLLKTRVQSAAVLPGAAPLGMPAVPPPAL